MNPLLPLRRTHANSLLVLLESHPRPLGEICSRFPWRRLDSVSIALLWGSSGFMVPWEGRGGLTLAARDWHPNDYECIGEDKDGDEELHCRVFGER